jgi:GDP-D-mannose dehydratase
MSKKKVALITGVTGQDGAYLKVISNLVLTSICVSRAGQ